METNKTVHTRFQGKLHGNEGPGKTWSVLGKEYMISHICLLMGENMGGLPHLKFLTNFMCVLSSLFLTWTEPIQIWNIQVCPPFQCSTCALEHYTLFSHSMWCTFDLYARTTELHNLKILKGWFIKMQRTLIFIKNWNNGTSFFYLFYSF